jgi:hypothetical protein
MTHALINISKDPLDLNSISGLKNKINELYKYTEVETIYCRIKNPDDYASPQPKKLLLVYDIAIPPGKPSYLKGKLTDHLKTFKRDIMKYVQGEDDYESIKRTLAGCLQKCQSAFAASNIYDTLSFYDTIFFMVDINGEWKQVFYDHLQFLNSARESFYEHFDIRIGLYNQLLNTLTESLQWHLQGKSDSKKPYRWDSKKAEREISELIYLLCEKGEIIQIDKNEGGSFAKFKKGFFSLFGLDDKRYSHHVSEILKRKKDQHFIDSLAALMPNTLPTIKKKK